MSKTILISGASGYIGSHFVKFFHQKGFHIVGLDLEQPPSALTPYLHEFLRSDMKEHDVVVDGCSRFDVKAVVHCAAKCLVAESVEKPELYQDYNVTRASAFASAAQKAGVKHFLFSSTAATYGEPKTVPIPETHLQQPINPYGETKLAFERTLLKKKKQGLLNVGIFRYFNAAGADPAGEIGEVHEPETHLLPNAIRACMNGSAFSLYGNDYPTRDGTCERDFIHVWDLADAHWRMIESMLKGNSGGTYNLGTGRGFTVNEVLTEIERQANKRIQRNIENRRPGDPAVLVADPTRAKTELDWNPTHSSLREVVETALRWHQKA